MKLADERGKKAMTDAARLAEELHQEQEHSMNIERMRKGLEQQDKCMNLCFLGLKVSIATIENSKKDKVKELQITVVFEIIQLPDKLLIMKFAAI